jgi:hypothetical protein
MERHKAAEFGSLLTAASSAKRFVILLQARAAKWLVILTTNRIAWLISDRGPEIQMNRERCRRAEDFLGARRE